MNLDLWKSISKDQQKKLSDAVREMEEQRYSIAEAQEAESLQILKEQGTIIISLSDQEVNAIRDKVRKVVWPEMRKEIGPMFDQVTVSADK